MATVNSRISTICVNDTIDGSSSTKSTTISQSKSDTSTTAKNKASSNKFTEVCVLDDDSSQSQTENKTLNIDEKGLNSIVSTLEKTKKDIEDELKILCSKEETFLKHSRSSFRNNSQRQTKFEPTTIAIDTYNKEDIAAFEREIGMSYNAFCAQKAELSQKIAQVDNIINKINDKKKTLSKTETKLEINGDDPIDCYIEYIYTLKTVGLIDTDISRVLRGKISIQDLLIEIENDKDDNLRRRKIYESSYLQECGLNFLSMEDLKSEITNLTTNIEELENRRKYLESNEMEVESEAVLNVVNRLRNGENLDDILTKTYFWKYVDENGNAIYTSVNPYQDLNDSSYVTENYVAISLESLLKDSELLKDLKDVLNKTSKKSLFGKEKTVEIWSDSAQQQAFLENLIVQNNKIKENKTLELNNLNNELKELRVQLNDYQGYYELINNKVSYYMDNIDKYIKNDDFNENNKFNIDSLGVIDSVSDNVYIGDEARTCIFISDDDAIDIISCMINNKGDLTGNSLMTETGLVSFQSKSGNIDISHYSKWASLLEPTEIEIFNYKYNTEGRDGAYQYLQNISDELDNRWLVKKQIEDGTFASEHKILASVGSIFVTPFEGLSAACYSLNSIIRNEKIRRTDVYSSGDIWRQKVSEDIAKDYGEGWAFVYSTGMSMADSVSLIGANILTGGAASFTLSATLMGSRAYVSTINEALDRGLSDGQAVALAFSSAVVETAMENLSLGHLTNLEGHLGDGVRMMAGKIANKIPNKTVANIATKGFYILASAASQGLCEGEEELATEIVNYIADISIAKDLSNYNQSIERYLSLGYSQDEALRLTMSDFSNQLNQAFIGGFVSGICFGIFGGVSSTIKTSYGVAHNMYSDFQGKTIAQNFAEALEVNYSQIEELEKASKTPKGSLTNEQINLLLNGTIEQQAGRALKDNVTQKVIGAFTKNNSSSNTDTSTSSSTDNNTHIVDDVHGYQLNRDDFGGWFKTNIDNGFFTEQQVNTMLSNVNNKGYISESSGKYFSSLFEDANCDIYIKTIHSSDVDSIMEEGIRCLGTSTSGYGVSPTDISGVNLDNTITKVDGAYDLITTLKSANGISQGMNPIDGTIVLKIPKGMDISEITYFSEKSETYCIKPEYIDSFSSVDANGVVSEPIFNEKSTSVIDSTSNTDIKETVSDNGGQQKQDRNAGLQSSTNSEFIGFRKGESDLNDLGINYVKEEKVYSSDIDSIINNFKGIETLSEVNRKFFYDQVERYMQLNNKPKTISVPKVDSNGKVILEKGTLIHGIHKYDASVIKSISDFGILSGQAFGAEEDGETFFCADFFRVPEETTMSSYKIEHNRLHDSGNSERFTPFPNSRHSQQCLAFIISPTSNDTDIFSYDCYRNGTEASDITKTFVNIDGLPLDSEHGSAILFGVPSNTISGIIAGSQVIQNAEAMDNLIKTFPNCYITDIDGNIIYNPSMELKEKVILSKENSIIDNVSYKDMAETTVDEGRKLKEGERIGFQFFANSDTTGTVKEQSISSNSTTSNIDYLTAEISKANYYTGKGNFYTIDVDSFDSIPSDFWSKIDDPSSVQFRKDGKIYSYLDAKELSGAYPLSGMNTSTTRTLDQEIANANYYTGKGNFYTIDVNNFDSIPSDFIEKIDNPSLLYFRKDGKVYSSSDFLNMKSNISTAESTTIDSNGVSSIQYAKPSTIEYAKQYLSSNVRKYFYKDTSQFAGLNEQIMQNGLYHFTTAADAILESGYIKASNLIDSYATPLSPTTKSFFFNGVPDVGAIATNIDSIPVKATAIKVDATTELVNDPKLKLRYIDDMAITYDGNFNLDGYNAQKCFFGLTVEDGRLVYKQISEEVYENYENTNIGKQLSEYVSNKNNLTAIKSDFFAKIFERNGIPNSSSIDNNTHIVDDEISYLKEKNPLLDFENVQYLLEERNQCISKLTMMAIDKGMTLKTLGSQEATLNITSDVRAKVNLMATNIRAKAESVEPTITNDMLLLESDNAHLVGLDFKLKSVDSLSRKILSDSIIEGKTLNDAASSIGDSVRYTLAVDNPENYTKIVTNSLNSLIQKGYTIKQTINEKGDIQTKFKNTWGNNIYQGVNVSLISPNGVTFELQFHTEQSFNTKENLNHLYYEIYRNMYTTVEEKEIAKRIMEINQSLVYVPPGILDLKLNL